MTKPSSLLLALLLAACSTSSELPADMPSPDAEPATPPAPDAAPEPESGCGPETCAGCCDGEVCHGGALETACGTAGAACVACADSFVCQEAACHVDPTSRWDLIVEGADVFEDNTAGGAWDVAGGLPDPFVDLATADEVDEYEGSTDVVDDTLGPVWNQQVLTAVPAAVLRDEGVAATVLDFDAVGGSDPMGTCQLGFDDASFAAAALSLICPSDPDGGARGWTLRFHLVRTP